MDAGNQQNPHRLHPYLVERRREIICAQAFIRRRIDISELARLAELFDRGPQLRGMAKAQRRSFQLHHKPLDPVIRRRMVKRRRHIAQCQVFFGKAVRPELVLVLGQILIERQVQNHLVGQRRRGHFLARHPAHDHADQRTDQHKSPHHHAGTLERRPQDIMDTPFFPGRFGFGNRREQ